MSRTLRVLHVVPYYPPDRIGGVGEVAAHIHRGLLDAGHQSCVLTSGTSHDDQNVRRVGHSSLGYLLKSARQLDLLRDCDVIHCHHGEALGLLLVNKLRRYKTPVLATFHCSCSGIGRAHRPYQLGGHRFATDFQARLQAGLIAPLRHLLDLAALKLCDRANFISRHGAVDILGSKRGAEANVIYYGLPELPARENKTSTQEIEPVELLYAGTPSHRKRINALPFVLARVREKIPAARLRIVGFELDNFPELKQLFIDQNVLDAVLCTGPKRSAELPPYYRAAGVLLVPSAHEGLPMVILEALQCGTPCVATRVSGHPEVIQDGVNGFLVDLDRPEQMAAAALKILTDPDRQHSMSNAAPPIIHERFSLDRQVREFLELYESLCPPRLD